jgi:hypothetical protein
MSAAVSHPEVSHSGSRTKPIAAQLLSIAEWIADYIEVTAHFYAAAARYEQLSRLSDAELRRRGLSREMLARDLLTQCRAARFE